MLNSDHQIIKSLFENDENALKVIFDKHFNKLYSFAIEFVINKEVAKEIVHDSFFRFWNHRHKLNAETNIRAYLLKIVRNLCLNYLKTKKRQQEIISIEDQLELELNYEVLVDPGWDKLLINELETILNQTISNLPEKCKKVFELSRYEQLTNQEIASQLNISVKTVEGHVTEALKIIRHKISRYLTIIILTSF